MLADGLALLLDDGSQLLYFFFATFHRPPRTLDFTLRGVGLFHVLHLRELRLCAAKLLCRVLLLVLLRLAKVFNVQQASTFFRKQFFKLTDSGLSR